MSDALSTNEFGDIAQSYSGQYSGDNQSYDITWHRADKLHHYKIIDEQKLSTETNKTVEKTTVQEWYKTSAAQKSANYGETGISIATSTTGLDLGVSTTGILASASATGVSLTGTGVLLSVSLALAGYQYSKSFYGILNSNTTSRRTFSYTSISEARRILIDAPTFDVSITRAPPVAQADKGKWPKISSTDLIKKLGADETSHLLRILRDKKYLEDGFKFVENETNDIFGIEKKLEELKWDPRCRSSKKSDNVDGLSITPTWSDDSYASSAYDGNKVIVNVGNAPSYVLNATDGRTLTLGVSNPIQFGTLNNIISGQRGVTARSEYRYFWDLSDHFYSKHNVRFDSYYQIAFQKWEGGLSTMSEGRAGMFMTENAIATVAGGLLFGSTHEDVDAIVRDAELQRDEASVGNATFSNNSPPDLRALFADESFLLGSLALKKLSTILSYGNNRLKLDAQNVAVYTEGQFLINGKSVSVCVDSVMVL
ncbi:hypothetical protein [Caballeronia zhejiangensis]|uniref:hypothetical protein n=1 Tax=Caballeronia zhejiangensis TaxID=871203 RepID=UPI0015892B06|nr:hypothetical protein [Caballeronia zhejiangensis]